jgi:hypothetical protein
MQDVQTNPTLDRFTSEVNARYRAIRLQRAVPSFSSLPSLQLLCGIWAEARRA